MDWELIALLSNHPPLFRRWFLFPVERVSSSTYEPLQPPTGNALPPISACDFAYGTPFAKRQCYVFWVKIGSGGARYWRAHPPSSSSSSSLPFVFGGRRADASTGFWLWHPQRWLTSPAHDPPPHPQPQPAFVADIESRRRQLQLQPGPKG